MNKIATEISLYIEENGIKQSYIAEKLGISPDLFSKTLLGQRRMPATEFFEICFILNVDPNYFYQKFISEKIA